MFHGRRTANGEIYDMEALTAAHPTLPLPSLARVTNLENGRSLVVRINDRGPYVGGRAIDLSWAVASLLQVEIAGTAPVRIQYLGPAPLDGDDSYERQVLAHQSWAGPRVAFAASPAKAMRYRRSASTASYQAAPRRERAAANPAPVPAEAAFWPDEAAAAPASRPLRPTASLPAATHLASASPEPVQSARRTGFADMPSETSPIRREAAPGRAASNGAGAVRQRRAYVDAGLFPDRRMAERLASTLTGLAPVAVEPETISGTTLHRLRVGPFATESDAAAAVARMRAAGLTGAYVQPAPNG